MKNINYLEIKEILEKNLIEVYSNIDENETFESIKTISNSSNMDLTFFSKIKFINDLKITKAKACLIEKKFVEFLPDTCKPIIVNDPYLALALVSNLIDDESLKSNGVISKKSVVNSNCKIHNNVQIDPFSLISYNTEICENV